MAKELKTKENEASVDSFLEAVDDEQQRSDSRVIVKMMQSITQEKPKMWGTSMIGFGAYSYKYASGQAGDWPLVAFSPRKQNLTLYIMPGFEKYDELMSKLGKYKTGKSCLYIKKLADIDLAIVEKLIKESVAYMKAKYKK